jgi:uncharacterized membrane protein YhaH (DUF805 family)
MSEQRTTFVDSIVDGFREWRSFSGRASRPQFWYWVLFTVLLNMVLSMLDNFLFPVSLPQLPVDPTLFSSNDLRAILDALTYQLEYSVANWVELALVVPTIAVTVRRFRDGGWPGWLAITVRVVPYVSAVVALVAGYSEVPLLAAPTDANVGQMIGLTLIMLLASILTIASLIVLLVGALRPSRSAGS